MMKKLITIIYFIYVTSFENVNSVEWDCASTSNQGTFTRSTDCTISGSNHVNVATTLEINGTNTDMNNLITITAAPTQRHRHFYINENAESAVLTLRYLKLVGGDTTYKLPGGSIHLGRRTCVLNLHSCIITNNKATEGGAIFAWGGGGKNVAMKIYNSIISNNEASSGNGGALRVRDAVATIVNTTIDGNQATIGEAGAMYIQDADVTLEGTIVSNNTANLRGGAFYIYGAVIIMRQSSFISNRARIGKAFSNNYYYGDDMYAITAVTISSINVYFNNPGNPRGIAAVSYYGTPTWKTCNANLCTESPFTGTCNAVHNSNSKLGVLCNLNCSANRYAPSVSVAISAPSSSDTCKPWQTCGAGYKRVNGNATSDANCVQCGQGQFQPANQFNGTSCQAWQDAKCNAGYKRVNGNATSDTTCIQCGEGQFQPANQFNGTSCQAWQDAKCNAGYKRVNGNATSDTTCMQCGEGQFQPVNQFNGTSCQAWQDAKCNAGYKRVNGNATSDTTCIQCGEGQFQPVNQFNGTSCTNWKQCDSNEYISFNGNRRTNRICVLKPTTTTNAPSVTTTTNAPSVTTTTNAPSVTTTTNAPSVTTTTNAPSVTTTTNAPSVTTTTNAPSVTTTTNATIATSASVSTAASVSIANTTSIAPLPTVATTSVTVAATTTKSSATSRSRRAPKENGGEEQLSTSIKNTFSTFSIIIAFIMAMCSNL